jgi:hypothetical protein
VNGDDDIKQPIAEGVIADDDGMLRVDPQVMRSFGTDGLASWDIERIRAWRRDYHASVRFDFADTVLSVDDLDRDPPRVDE